MRKWIIVSLVVGIGLAFACHDIEAAKARKKVDRKSKSVPARAVSTRLPRYFGQLDLDEQQRDEVYAIQADYGEQIEKLREQLADVQQQRDEDLQDVLTPAQRKEFSKLIDKTGSRKTSAEKSGTSKTPRRKRKKAAPQST